MKSLSKLPVASKSSMISTPDYPLDIFSYQIVFRGCLSNYLDIDPPDKPLLFAMILDAENNTNFAIRKTHLDRWAHGVFEENGFAKIGAVSVPRREAVLWINPNIPGTNQVSDKPPFRVELEGGMAVFPPDVPNSARLPILGLKAIFKNNLKLIVNGETGRVDLKQGGWL